MCNFQVFREVRIIYLFLTLPIEHSSELIIFFVDSQKCEIRGKFVTLKSELKPNVLHQRIYVEKPMKTGHIPRKFRVGTSLNVYFTNSTLAIDWTLFFIYFRLPHVLQNLRKRSEWEDSMKSEIYPGSVKKETGWGVESLKLIKQRCRESSKLCRLIFVVRTFSDLLVRTAIIEQLG